MQEKDNRKIKEIKVRWKCYKDIIKLTNINDYEKLSNIRKIVKITTADLK